LTIINTNNLFYVPLVFLTLRFVGLLADVGAFSAERPFLGCWASSAAALFSTSSFVRSSNGSSVWPPFFFVAAFLPDAGAARFVGPFLAVAPLDFSSVGGSSSSDNLRSSFTGVSSAFLPLRLVVVFFFVSISSVCSFSFSTSGGLVLFFCPCFRPGLPLAFLVGESSSFSTSTFGVSSSSGLTVVFPGWRLPPLAPVVFVFFPSSSAESSPAASFWSFSASAFFPDRPDLAPVLFVTFFVGLVCSVSIGCWFSSSTFFLKNKID